jgi:cytolysin-activating lysine-acyltransferase
VGKNKAQTKASRERGTPREQVKAAASAINGAPEAKQDAPSAGAAGEKKLPPSEFAGKTVASVFGEIVWLLSQSPQHRDLKLSDLEWLVMPPLLLRQFKLYYQGKQPVAVELFAKVSPEIAKRIDAGDKKLKPAEWRSGEITKQIEEIKLTIGHSKSVASN